MRRLEYARPARTATAPARNGGEAVQQLAHVARERQRLGQERQTLMRRIHKIDARLDGIKTLEGKLLPMMRDEFEKAKPPAVETSAAPSPAPPVRRPAMMPIGMSQVTLQY